MLTVVPQGGARFDATTERVGGGVRAWYTASTGSGPERVHEYTTMLFPNDREAGQWLRTEADIRGFKSFPTKRI